MKDRESEEMDLLQVVYQAAVLTFAAGTSKSVATSKAAVSAGTDVLSFRGKAWADKKFLRGEMVLLRELKEIAFNFQRCCELER
jgi:hypothetical protein